MAPRNSELPEGTDHIVTGAAETRTPGRGGFVASAAPRDDTGGAATGGTAFDNVKTQLRDGATDLRVQATGKAREYATEGKDRATAAIADFAKVVGEAADSIDEKLGPQYGQYARQAADTVSGFADTLKGKDVDELYDGAVSLVRKSPAVAIGIAAAVGFALVRVVKAGLEDKGETDVTFTPDQTGTPGQTGGSGSRGTGA